MSDVFNRRTLQFGGSFSADAASINFSTNSALFQAGVGLVTQSLQISYQQPITRLYEVGTNLTYYIAGRPQGMMSMARILGPGSVTAQFYRSFGDVCLANANHLVFDVATGCQPGGAGGVGAFGSSAVNAGVGSGGSTRMYFLANNVLIQSMGLSVGAQDMIINEQLSMMFSSLEAFDNFLALEASLLFTYGKFE